MPGLARGHNLCSARAPGRRPPGPLRRSPFLRAREATPPLDPPPLCRGRPARRPGAARRGAPRARRLRPRARFRRPPGPPADRSALQLRRARQRPVRVGTRPPRPQGCRGQLRARLLPFGSRLPVRRRRPRRGQGGPRSPWRRHRPLLSRSQRAVARHGDATGARRWPADTQEGLPVLLEALALLDAAGHRVCCRVVGSGEQRDELQAIVAALGLGERVELIGSRTQEEVAALCRSAAVFVQASVVLDNGDRDGIPNALLEAMASGLAVVGSAVGGIPEVVEHEVTGLLVPPSDPAALAAAIAGLDDDRVALARLGAAARSHVVLNLSRRALVGSIVPLFASRREPTPVGP
ncbi:MAG: glycosyltransferase [Acidimicrobiales bacterium]